MHRGGDRRGRLLHRVPRALGAQRQEVRPQAHVRQQRRRPGGVQARDPDMPQAERTQPPHHQVRGLARPATDLGHLRDPLAHQVLQARRPRAAHERARALASARSGHTQDIRRRVRGRRRPARPSHHPSRYQVRERARRRPGRPSDVVIVVVTSPALEPETLAVGRGVELRRVRLRLGDEARIRAKRDRHLAQRRAARRRRDTKVHDARLPLARDGRLVLEPAHQHQVGHLGARLPALQAVLLSDALR